VSDNERGLLLSGLLLTGNRALGALASPGIRLGPLPSYRQATTVPKTLVTADLDLAANISCHFSAKVTLNFEVCLDVIPQSNQGFIIKVFDP
jgi:hypothetical protein